MFFAKSPFPKMHRFCINCWFIFSTFWLNFGIFFSSFSASIIDFWNIFGPKWLPKWTLFGTIFDHFRPKRLQKSIRPNESERPGSDPAPNEPPKLIYTDFSRFWDPLGPFWGSFLVVFSTFSRFGGVC